MLSGAVPLTVLLSTMAMTQAAFVFVVESYGYTVGYFVELFHWDSSG